MSDNETYGFSRRNGKVGVRNHLAIIPTVFCVNEVVAAIADRVPGSKALTHNNGCCELSPDLERVTQTLSGLIRNPNVGGCVIVSLGCEGVQADELLRSAESEGKPYFHVVLQEVGGMTKCVEASLKEIPSIEAQMRACDRIKLEPSHIVLGIKCGSSDATSGLASNPAVGSAVDVLIDQGGRVLFGETTELLGAEHVLAQRSANEETRRAIFDIVGKMEERIKRVGVDLRGSQPTPGNIKGGLTTIEEKSLGAISKSGTAPIQGVLEYGQFADGQGLYLMDSPGKENEVMTGLAAAGANLIVFSTGGGAPQGFPLVPVIKVAGNPKKYALMQEHIDVDATSIVLGKESVDSVGRRIWQEMLEVAGGKKTRAESLGYDKTIGIYTTGPSV